MRAARSLLPNASAFFLATDDPSVVDEARIAATAADLPLYAMLANPPASAGTAPPPLWDSAPPPCQTQFA